MDTLVFLASQSHHSTNILFQSLWPIVSELINIQEVSDLSLKVRVHNYVGSHRGEANFFYVDNLVISELHLGGGGENMF